MFRASITNPIPPLTTDFIGTFRRIENEPDYSLVSLGCAVFRDKIPSYNGFSGTYKSTNTQLDAFEDFKTQMQNADDLHPVFCYYKYSKSDEKNDEKYIEENFNDMKSADSVVGFFKNKAEIEIRILVSNTKNAVGIFINSNDFIFYHLCLSFLSLFYPRIISEHPLTKEDLDIFKSLCYKDSSIFIRNTSAALAKYDNEIKRFSITKVFNGIFEKKEQALKREVDGYRRQADTAYEHYLDFMERLQEAKERYEGAVICRRNPDQNNDIADYLAENKNIINLSTEPGMIEFIVITTLQCFSEGVWEHYKGLGHIYEGDYYAELPPEFRIKENRRLLMDNLFDSDFKFAVKMCGLYRLYIERNEMKTQSGYDYVAKNPILNTYVPNTHLQKFGCLGGYETPVNNALRDGNMLPALEMCIASAGSIDPDETEQTFRPFIGSILSSKEKILVDKDGVEYTPIEALNKLLEEDKPKRKTTKRKVKHEEDKPDED